MYVIGLDVGTTGVKAIVCDKDGKVYGTGYKEYGIEAKGNNIVEQNADDWTASAVVAITQAVKKVDRKKVVAMSLSTQGASMLAVDKNFRPLCNVITWMDHRAGEQAEYIRNTLGAENCYRKAGWRLSSSIDAPKILWLKQNEPDIFNNAANFVSTLEYLNYFLTGNNVSDPTNSAIRGLVDINKGEWDEDMLNTLGITAQQLPTLMPTGAKVGTLTEAAAKALGLPESVAVYNGAHDQYCASLGSGAVANGDMLLATGTTWVVFAVADKLMYTENHIAPGIHPVKGLYGAMASLVSAGSALKWIKGIIGESYADIDAGAAIRRQSAKNILFAPFVAGTGFPHTEKIDACVAGFTINNDKYDLALALMEGVAFEARTVLEEFAKNGTSIERLYMAGRAAYSDVWRGIVRDITGCEVFLTETEDTGCMGAAAIAAAGCGMYDDLYSAVRGMVRLSRSEKADPEQHAFYNEKYARYQKHIEMLSKQESK